jgi:hypothetical protein
MIIYVDSEFKCHITNDGTMTPIETDFFDDKCEAFIEGYRFVPTGAEWTRSDGTVFRGEMVSPCKPYSELNAAQRAYEKEQLEQYKVELAELDAIILDMQYQNLVEGL